MSLEVPPLGQHLPPARARPRQDIFSPRASPGWAQKALCEPFWPLKHPDHEPLQWELSYWAFPGNNPRSSAWGCGAEAAVRDASIVHCHLNALEISASKSHPLVRQ